MIPRALEPEFEPDLPLSRQVHPAWISSNRFLCSHAPLSSHDYTRASSGRNWKSAGWTGAEIRPKIQRLSPVKPPVHTAKPVGPIGSAISSLSGKAYVQPAHERSMASGV